MGWAGAPSSTRQIKQGQKVFSLLSKVGSLLIFLSVSGLIFSFGPVLQAELKYRLSKNTSVKNSAGFHQLLLLSSTAVAEAPDANFSLVIPKIDAKSAIIANVNASNQQEYTQALRKGVAHAAGTVFPGMKGTILLFAHSTDAPWNISRYNAVFYLLKELVPGDQVLVFFEGKKHYYSVVESKIVEPTQTDFFRQSQEEMLVLQTCWPPGTTKKVLLVMAKPEGNK